MDDGRIGRGHQGRQGRTGDVRDERGRGPRGEDRGRGRGTKLLAGVKAGAAEDASCTFSGDPNGPTAQVEIHVGPGAKKYLDIDKQLGHEFTAQSGIGDEAYVEDFAVFARKGTSWVAITLVRLDDFDPYRTKMLELAKAIVAKL